jgi:hypothetical protein
MVRRTRRKQRQQKLRRTRRQIGGGSENPLSDFITAVKRNREELDVRYRDRQVTSYPLEELIDAQIPELLTSITINTHSGSETNGLNPYKLSDLGANLRAVLQQYSEGLPIVDTATIDKLLLKDAILQADVKRIEDYLWSNSTDRTDPMSGKEKAPTLMHYVLANLPAKVEPTRPVLTPLTPTE